MRTGIVTVGAAAALAVALVATGALGEREDARARPLAIGEQLETSRADIVVEGFERTGAGELVVTLTVTNALPVGLQIDDLLSIVDDDGELARFGQVSAGDVSAFVAHPGVADTFTIVYEPDRPAADDVRIVLVDATWTPRDETAFGLGANMYDEHAVAIVALP
ncbi:hypothetical protein GCM10009846_21130 [Agrococcus versicolor]|uniref:DUF4352 domain-containing protein n=1 Tax=Agrococcus versicolor TaxID=501482 RepID=A0ABP5MIY6_9MICO